ncbi:putative enoyl CoA hydratase [Cichlidogyrus casuarinus]|uniref:Enoyl CoA hydratase n=1 Tax=Cichlidogyrus casuarinus TaxID=1844966 RepID=A0ABD2QKV0_9PLAT
MYLNPFLKNNKFVLNSYTLLPKLKFSINKQIDTNVHLLHLEISQPEKKNALSIADFISLKKHIEHLRDTPTLRCGLITGNGNIFTSGIDLSSFGEILNKLKASTDPARKSAILYGSIKELQETLFAIHKVNKPIIAAIDGPCIGAGTDLVCYADIRYCTIDSYFQVKEIILGIPADIGSMQLLPKVVNNQSIAKELIYTGRPFSADEALRLGFVSQVFESRSQMLRKAHETANTICALSPMAMQACKQSLNFSLDHSISDGLDHIAILNSAILQGEEFVESLQALMNKRKPEFKD